MRYSKKVEVPQVVEKLRLVGVDVSSSTDDEILSIYFNLQDAGVFERYYSCSRKEGRFGTLQEATLGAYRQEMFRRDKTYVPYKCRYCWGYHVGSKKNREYD